MVLYLLWFYIYYGFIFIMVLYSIMVLYFNFYKKIEIFFKLFIDFIIKTMNNRHVYISKTKKKNGKEIVLTLNRIREIIETECAIKNNVETRLDRMLLLRASCARLNLDSYNRL